MLILLVFCRLLVLEDSSLSADRSSVWWISCGKTWTCLPLQIIEALPLPAPSQKQKKIHRFTIINCYNSYNEKKKINIKSLTFVESMILTIETYQVFCIIIFFIRF